MNNSKKIKLGAVVITMFLLLGMSIIPMSGALNIEKNNIFNQSFDSDFEYDKGGPVRLDTYYVNPDLPENEVSYANYQDDLGYNTDAGPTYNRGIPIYVNEPIDQSVPGRGRTGRIDPDDNDHEDYFYFSACEGQSIQVSVSGGNFGVEITDKDDSLGQSYTFTETGKYYVHVYANEGASAGDYTLNIALTGQNDAGIGGDAGDNINEATPIIPGEYYGFMDINDWEDWYSFSANSGDGIFFEVKPIDNKVREGDFDIYLYNPSGVEVHSEHYYGKDEIEYPADASGTWSIKIDLFPGWDESKWSDNYFLYGSGAYEIELEVGDTADAPPAPIPQPDITPIAQTFIINDDPISNKDEYSYLAAVPAANYLDNGQRYLSPIVYQGVDLVPTWFSTVDQTTQYLIDDWDEYLSHFGIEANEYTLTNNPIQDAANIATSKWTSSDTAVITVDGSVFEDEIRNVVNRDATLDSTPKIITVQPGEFRSIAGTSAYPMFIGKNVGAMHLIATGDGFRGDTGVVTPRYEGIMEDWWPHAYGNIGPGPDIDTFFPITLPGIWFAYVTNEAGLEDLSIYQYPGDRYSIPISSTDSSIEVTIETEEPSNLMVYLVDPEGNLRAPRMEHYNGGDIKPIHRWNGGHWEHDFNEFRTLIVEPHDDLTVRIHHPMEGKWTAIVVPYLDIETQIASFSGSYHITANVREYNQDRLSAGLSAANGAVIASMNHAPLLYVTEDSVPSQTSNAISQLGVNNIIFVNINGVSSASLSGSFDEYKSMQDVINLIKSNDNTENFITVTSLGSGDGYFAPAAMAAAYHVSPVLNIGEAPEAYNTLGMAATWREYGGDFYHGCRSLGHLPDLGAPFDLMKVIRAFINNDSFPSYGFDLKLRWMSAINKDVVNMITNYGLDQDGQEVYLFVADREEDIRDLICRAMTGNNSYAGHIPVPTAAFSTALICRNLLYPAIIYANPGRDVTTAQMMNFPDGRQWATNDGRNTPVFSSRELKRSFSSHGRFFEGHCIWDNLLERYNEGASLCYYSGHGTGGSGISAQYYNVNDVFPENDMKYDEQLKDKNWWDAWRGYMYDDTQTKSPRYGGFTWYNSEEPNLYDLIHFKWVDQLFDNLHSLCDLWMSCTTQAHYGPIVYLSHGAVFCFGNAGTGLCPQADLLDDQWIREWCENGVGVGEAFSKYMWLHQRDYTTLDPTTLYGASSMQVTNMQEFFGDPTLIVYSPEWTEPIPIQ